MDADSFVLVIGSGAAGTAAARTLRDAGLQVAVVEDDRVGGTCLWHGCMPKKALYNAALTFREDAEAESFGAVCEGRRLDWESVLAWKWHAMESYAGDPIADFEKRGIRLLRGTARFEAPLAVRVGGELIQPTDIVIASGSAPVIPPIPGADAADTSLDALRYPAPPASLAIVGGGYIAFEFAGIYAAFGTNVTMLVRSERLLEGYDPEIVAIAVRRLESMGVSFRLGAPAESIECGEGGSTVRLKGGDVVESERVLLATGRESRLRELDPVTGGIAVDDRGRPVLDPFGLTSHPQVWVAGDARGGAMHTPLANAEGHAVARAMLGQEREPLDTSSMPTAVFTFPQLAQVGVTEAQIRAAGGACRVHREPLAGVGAAVISDDRDGLVKVVADEKDRVIGAQIAAPAASDLVYTYALAVRGGISLGDVRATPAVHPAYSQALEWAAW